MDPSALAGIIVLILLILLALEVPVAWSLAISGAIGIAFVGSPSNAFNLLRESPLGDVSVYALVVIPMYMLLGNLALNGRLAGQVFAVAVKLAGRSRWALGVATIAACGAFSAVSGSSVATAAIMSRIALPEMIKYGYPARYAAGIVAAGGTLGILIPPSIILVIYGIVTEQSISRLLAAGILPGILSMLAYAVYVIVRVAPSVKPVLATAFEAEKSAQGPVMVENEDLDPRAKKKLKAMSIDDAVVTSVGTEKVPYRGLFRAGIIFALVFVGIYFGWMTVSESAALAALAALFFLVIELRKEGFLSIWRALKASLQETAATTSMVFAILIGSSIFSYFIVLTGLPRRFSQWVATLDVPPMLIIILFLLILIPMGMALDSLAIIVLAMPFMYPVVDELGFSGIWFGILAVKLIEVGLMTPPVGINVFVVAGSARQHVTTEQVFRGCFGFILVDVIVIAILIAFPDIILFLPSLI